MAAPHSVPSPAQLAGQLQWDTAARTGDLALHGFMAGR